MKKYNTFKKYKNFCAYPFMHVVQLPFDSEKANGSAIPCCRINVSKCTESEDVINPTSTSNIWKNLQLEFLCDRRPEVCQKCWDVEDSGIESYRQQGLKTFLTGETNILDGKLRYLEITMSNVCNLACRSCNSSYSSKWIPIDKFLIDNNIDRHITSNLSFTNWRKLDLSNLTRLKLMGGEPLYIKDTFDLLEHLDSLNLLETMTIEFPSNCTIFPSRQFLKLLHKAKHVQIQLSIDGYGELNDYIRSGSDWKTIDQNLKKYAGLCENNPLKFIIGTNTVITALNVNRIVELKDYLTSISKRFTLGFDVTAFPKYLSIRSFPENIKQSLYNTVIDDIKYFFDNSSYDEASFSTLKNMINLLDDYHGTSFREVNPTMYSLIFSN